MTKTKNKEYFAPVDFYIEGYPACCGIEIVCNLELPTDAYPDDYYRFPTLDKAVDHFCKEVNKQRRKSCLQITIVTKYNGHRKGAPDSAQMPDGFVEALVERKWKIDQVFKNSNTGNEVTVLSKVFPKKRAPKTTNLFAPAGNRYGL